MQAFLYIRVSPLALYNGTQSIHQCVVDIYHYMSHIIYIYKQIPLSRSTTYGAGEDKTKCTCPKRGNFQRSVSTVLRTTDNSAGPVSGGGPHTSLRETAGDKIRKHSVRKTRSASSQSLSDRYNNVQPRPNNYPPRAHKAIRKPVFSFCFSHIILYDFFFYRLRRRFVSTPPPYYCVCPCKVALRILCTRNTRKPKYP